jgi:hypothetical protein
VVRRETPMRGRQCSLLESAALALLTLGGSGCNDSATQPPRPAHQQGGSQGGAPKDVNAPIDLSFVDLSLTPEGYLRLGLPAHDREWSGRDMVQAEKVLAPLARKGYRQLPRYKSERSGEVFARLTSPQNLGLFRNRTLPVEPRLADAVDYLRAGNQVAKLYLAGFLKKEVRDSELVEWYGAQLRSVAVLFELIDEFLASMGKDDPRYRARMQDLGQMKGSLAGIVAGCFQTLTERNSYRGSELVRLVGYMRETLPLIVPRLPPGARTETLLRLEKMQDDSTLKDLQPGLRELHLKVKASAEKGATP